MLNYKKPGFWIVLVAVIVCIIVAVTMLTDPVSPRTPAVIFEELNSEDVWWVSLTYWGTETENLTLTGDQQAQLLEILKTLDPKDFKESGYGGATYQSGKLSLMIYCGQREILLSYDGEEVAFTFDSDTAEQIGDTGWSVCSEELNAFLDNFGYPMDQTSISGAEEYNIELVETMACDNAVWGIVEMTVPEGIEMDRISVENVQHTCNGVIGKAGSYMLEWDTDTRVARLEFLFSVNVISPGLAAMTFDITDRTTHEVLEPGVSVIWMVDEILKAKTYTADSGTMAIRLSISSIYLEAEASSAGYENYYELVEDIRIVLNNGETVTLNGSTSGAASQDYVRAGMAVSDLGIEPDQIQAVYVGGVKLEEGSEQALSGRSYVFMDPQDGLLTSSHLQLYSDFTFSFSFSPISSYWGHGTYEITDGKVILRTDDGYFHYTFKLAGEDLIFVAEESSEQVWFSGLTDGSIMRYISEE